MRLPPRSPVTKGQASTCDLMGHAGRCAQGDYSIANMTRATSPDVALAVVRHQGLEPRTR